MRARLRQVRQFNSWPGWVVAAGLLVVGFPALDQYNVTWDEALGDLFFGQRYLSFFTSFDPTYLDFHAEPYPPDHEPDLTASPFRGRAWEYYPVANTLAAATSKVLSALDLVDPFDGFHALNLLLAALLAVVLHEFLRRRYGRLAAALSLGFLFGSPRIVFHMMANIKDFPLMVFWSLAACAYFSAWQRGSFRGLVAAGALVGLALGTKGNALFFPILPALVLISCGIPDTWRRESPRAFLRSKAIRVAAAAGVAAMAAVAVMVALWPYLWADPISRFARHLGYIAGRRSFTSPESMAPVLEALWWTTPPVFLLTAVIGATWLLVRVARRHSRRAEDVFLLAWCIASLGRYLLPQAVNFDGVRHFLELFPALAAIAGIATAALARRLARIAVGSSPTENRVRLRLATVLSMLLLLPGLVQVVRTHPFQVAYWNTWAGGLDGAREKNLPQASDYWGASYRLGMRWLNEHAEPGAYVAVPVVEHAVRLVAPLRLREDLVLLPITTPLSPRIAPERLAATRDLATRAPVYVMFVERRDWANELMVECLRRLTPEVIWTLDGAPVLSIYRYVPPGTPP
ncbi:MAG: glycosyltransferase family 39 protein [Thermoanaerobaculia bacterium]|nr:glycosyltransferase family 39 protein [Thermoanaerobaculia bacterium]